MKGALQLTGMPCSTYEAFLSTMRRVIARSNGIALHDGSILYAFKDRSGLCISCFADATEQLRCATPFVVGASRVRAASVEIEETNDCPYCDVYVIDVVDDADAVLYALRFFPADVAVTRHFVKTAPAPVFNITAFGRDVRVHAKWASRVEASLEPTHDAAGDTIRLVGSETLHLATADANGEPVSTPDVFMTATVLSAKKRQNGITGISHVQCLVQTAGSIFDVILAGDAKPAEVPKPGMILEGTFTLCGVLVSKDGVTSRDEQE